MRSLSDFFQGNRSKTNAYTCQCERQRVLNGSKGNRCHGLMGIDICIGKSSVARYGAYTDVFLFVRINFERQQTIRDKVITAGFEPTDELSNAGVAYQL
jgi:hypothetical protein